MRSRRIVRLGLVLSLVAGAMWLPGAGSANHSVLVEGEADFDGDGLRGQAEDLDGDTVFGTITVALSSTTGAANQNGRVTIVSSGRFVEQVVITAANGNVTLEAAPGVEANIEAVRSGDAGNATRQAQPGIVVDAPAERRVTLRNLVSRNWTVGILVKGDSRVAIDGCRLENNVRYGLLLEGNARASVSACQINGSGFRSAAAPVDNTPNPGTGIGVRHAASASIHFSAVTGSFSAGIRDQTSQMIKLSQVQLFDNNPNYQG